MKEQVEAVFNTLATMADAFDSIGFIEGADQIDALIKKVGQSDDGIFYPKPISREHQLELTRGKYGLIGKIRLLSKQVQREFKGKYEDFGPEMENVIESILSLFQQLDTVVGNAESILSNMARA